jgi:hypothetical protein
MHGAHLQGLSVGQFFLRHHSANPPCPRETKERKNVKSWALSPHALQLSVEMPSMFDAYMSPTGPLPHQLGVPVCAIIKKSRLPQTNEREGISRFEGLVSAH